MNAFPPNSAILREFSHPVFLKTYKYYQVLKTSIMNCLQNFIIDCLQASTILPFLLTLVVAYLSHMIREEVESLFRTFTRGKKTTHKSFGNGTATFFAFLNEID